MVVYHLRCTNIVYFFANYTQVIHQGLRSLTSSTSYQFWSSIISFIHFPHLANEARYVQLFPLIKMAPSDSAHEDARRAHLCQSVCEISVMIFVDVTYIDTILRFRPNNDRLRDVTARLEKLARLLGKEFNSDTQNNMISLSLEHAPVSMETVFTDANPTAPEYRTAKARFLSQAISYAIELVLFDGSKSGVSVLEERMKQLKIVRGATIMERRMVDFLYPHSVVFPTTERPIYASFYTEIQTKYLNEANKISRLREIISHTLDVLKAEGTPVNKAIDSKGQPDLVATSEAEPTGKR